MFDRILNTLPVFQDPEKAQTLEELEVVREELVTVKHVNGKNEYLINIEFVPTVPHCSLASLIGKMNIIPQLANTCLKVLIMY